MKLWMSGRIDHDIDNIFFGRVLREVKNEINAAIEGKDYGSAIESWDVIMVIYSETIEGSFKYNGRTKETDIEIPIDYEKFKKGDLRESKRLFFDALILSLRKLETSRRKIDFEFQRAIDDITLVAEKSLM